METEGFVMISFIQILELISNVNLCAKEEKVSRLNLLKFKFKFW